MWWSSTANVCKSKLTAVNGDGVGRADQDRGDSIPEPEAGESKRLVNPAAGTELN